MLCRLALSALLASTAARAQEPERPTVLLVGSSSVNGAVGRTLERELGAFGVDLVRRARASSGFARPDFFDWEAEVQALGRLDRYAAVIVYAGGNDAQALRLRETERTDRRETWVRWREEARWTELYAARVRAVVDAMCDRGAPRVIVMPPIDGGRNGWSARIRRVIEAQRAGTGASRCGVVVDANDGDVFDSLDGVHLSWRGARRMWARVGRPIRELLLSEP